MTKIDHIKRDGPAIDHRIQWLDVCKGILIFFVILDHSYPPRLYERFYTPFFLTMFFFVSGYTFSTKSSFKAFIVNKGRRLLIPFFVLGLSRILAYQAIDGGSIAQRLKGFVLQINGRYDEMWFLSCMFSSSLLFYFIVNICRRQKQFSEEKLVLVISSVISILGFIDICVWKTKFIWEIETACMMVSYMAIGYWYRRCKTGAFHGLEKAVFVIPLAIFYTCFVLLFGNEVNIHMQRFEYPILFIVSSLIAVPLIIYASKLLGRSWLRRALAFLGENTLFYYAYAGVIRILLYAACGYLDLENEWIIPIVCALLSAVLMAFPAWFVRKYLPFAVGGSGTQNASLAITRI